MIESQLVLNVAVRFRHIRSRVMEKAINVVLDEIVAAMARKDRIELRGFGAFSVKDRAGRIGRNPKSGVKVHVAEKGSQCSSRAKKSADGSTLLLRYQSHQNGLLGVAISVSFSNPLFPGMSAYFNRPVL